MDNLTSLYTLVRLLKEFNLPVSPILDYAIREKIEALGGNITDYESDTYAEFKYEDSSIDTSSSLRVEFPDGTIIK